MFLSYPGSCCSLDITNLPPGVTIDDISPYGYVPTRAISFLFLALFGLSTGALMDNPTYIVNEVLMLDLGMHFIQAIYFRLWFLLPTVVLCGLGELVGWSGRLWSSYNIQEDNAFLMQYVCRVTDGCVPDGFTGSRLLLLHLPREYIAAQDVHSAVYPFPDSLPPISLCSEGLS